MFDRPLSHTSPGGNRFAVVYPGFYGPKVSFWPNMRSVLSLMVRHANSGLQGFAVWERATPKAHSWKCIAGGAE